MGMPITIEIVDRQAKNQDFEDVFNYFIHIDNIFSPFKKTSELAKVNSGLPKSKYSQEMKLIFALAEETKKNTNGYFNIKNDTKYDTSGIVKGWAILNVSLILKKKNFLNFYIEAGGDIEMHGKNSSGGNWTIGIRNPFNINQIIKTIVLTNKGIATSGTYIRGQHVYNPLNLSKKLEKTVSLTVIGPNVYEADRYATAALAMDGKGIYFIEELDGFEAYSIDKHGIATMTTGFNKYIKS